MTAPISSRWRIAAMTAIAVLASCQPRIIPQPAPRPPAPAPAPPPVASAPDWQDWPLTPGTWSYRQAGDERLALYGPPSSDALVRLSCDRAARQVTLTIAGPADTSRMATIRTSYGALQWPANPTGGAIPHLVVVRAASDPGLDWIAFSRGRFTVELPGRAPLVLPSWAEPARVVEDCRG